MLARTDRWGRSAALAGLLGVALLGGQGCDGSGPNVVSGDGAGASAPSGGAEDGEPNSSGGSSDTGAPGASLGSGGDVGLGGSVGSGGLGQSGGSGGFGTAAGGVVSPGGSASGGTPATGGIEDALACTTDKQCQPLGLLCDLERGRCVDCVTNDNCGQNWLCVDGDCVFDDSCTSGQQCAEAPDGRTLCDKNRGLCVQCVELGDCPSNHECIEYRCVPYSTCTETRNCAASDQVCDTDAGRCVDCVSDGDCREADLPVCRASVCRAACSSTEECPDALRCLRSAGYCVECRGSEECDSSAHCVDGVCRPDVCSAEQSRCQAGGVAPCNEEGDGFGTVEPCEDGEGCVAASGIAQCQPVDPAGGGGEGGATGVGGEGGTESAGGAESVGGAESTGGSAGTCAGPGDPCVSIPRFGSNQVVDADGSEFCDVPFFELDFGTNNAAVMDWREEGPYPEHALARIAWSEDALHVWIEVTDPTVLAWSGNDLWEADAVEVMARVRSEPTGNLNDEDALHAIATWNAAVMRDASGTYQPMHVALYEGKLTETGYAVELRLPWPDGVGTLQGGGAVWFDMTLNASNAQDGVTWRDAQAMFYLGSASAGCAEPGCNDLLWCMSGLE